MSFEARGDGVIAAHDVEELKLVFRVLYSRLAEHPELMDTHFLSELQRFLHRLAQADGVDIADHSAWDRWLGNANGPLREVRLQARRTIEPS